MLDFTLNQHNSAQAVAFYQRLRQLDEALPAELANNKVLSYIKALEKVKKEQQSELNKLRKNYLDLVTIHLLANEDVSYESSIDHIETFHTILDDINIEIICSKIDLQSTTLDLEGTGITRFPSQLLTNPHYTEYFNQLETINLDNNYLRTLTLRNLPSLAIIDCESNKLLSIKLENLTCLQDIDFSNNRIQGSYDLSIFPMLNAVSFHNNQIDEINVAGLNNLMRLDCSCNHLTSLYVDSAVITDLNCSWNYLHTLVVENPHLLELPEQDGIDELGGLHLYSNALFAMPPNLVEKFGSDWAQDEMISQSNYGFTQASLNTVDDIKPVVLANAALEDASAFFESEISHMISSIEYEQPIQQESPAPASVLVQFESTTSRMRTRSQTRKEASQQVQHQPQQKKSRK